jgi:hypothetical protein
LGIIRQTFYFRHPVIGFFLVLLGGVIFAPLFSAWLHLCVYVVGGRKSFTNTLKAVMYGATPVLLLSWIPLIGIIFYLWGMVLAIFGIHELHEIEGDQAAFAVIVAAVIVVVIIVLLMARLFLASIIMYTPLSRI